MYPTRPEPAEIEPFLRTTCRTNGSGVATRDDRQAAPGIHDAPPLGVDPAVIDQLLQWPAFAVTAIRIDSPATPPDAAGEPHATLERLLSALQSSHHALWFAWRANLFGCLFPDMDSEAALALGRKLQDDLKRECPETVSIGVTAFPLDSYDHVQSLANACKALDHAAFFGPGSAVIFDAVSLNISGDQYYQQGRMQAAVAEYRAALRLDPHNPNVHNSLGVCMARLNDAAAARACFQAVLELDPRESMAVFNLGMLKQLDNDTEAALGFFKSAFELDPNSFEITLQMGALLAELQRWEEARPYLETAIALQPGSGRAHSWLGQCLAGLNQSTEAIRALSKAAKLNPNDAAALSALGVLYAAAGENPDVCMTFCRQSVALAPHNGYFRHRLGCLYQQYDRLDQALAEFESAAALGYDSSRQIDEVRRLIHSGADNNIVPDCRQAAS